MNEPNDEKGISPAMGIILIFVVTILLAASFYSNLNLNQMNKPVFALLQPENKVIPHKSGMERDSQIVRVRDIGGEIIDVKRMKLTVTIYRNGSILAEETCYGFPVKKFGDARCSGDDIIDKGYLGYGVLGEFHSSQDGIFSPGEFVGFRIKARTDYGIQLEKGDRVAVQITDIYSGQTIARIEINV